MQTVRWVLLLLICPGWPVAGELVAQGTWKLPARGAVFYERALYLLDMHRDVIEHPEWIPDEIEATLDLDAGKNKGRVYRITPRAGLPRLRPELDRASPGVLVETLGHPNKWWRGDDCRTEGLRKRTLDGCSGSSRLLRP